MANKYHVEKIEPEIMDEYAYLLSDPMIQQIKAGEMRGIGGSVEGKKSGVLAFAFAGNSVIISAIHVDPQKRNKGLGTHLLSTLEVLAKKNGKKKIEISFALIADNDIRPFLKKNKFTEIKENFKLYEISYLLLTGLLAYDRNIRMMRRRAIRLIQRKEIQPLNELRKEDKEDYRNLNPQEELSYVLWKKGKIVGDAIITLTEDGNYCFTDYRLEREYETDGPGIIYVCLGSVLLQMKPQQGLYIVANTEKQRRMLSYFLAQADGGYREITNYQAQKSLL